jgi:hypothetical protein
VERRAALHAGRLAGTPGGKAAGDLAPLPKDLRREAERVLASHDPRPELGTLVEGARRMVLGTVLLAGLALILGVADFAMRREAGVTGVLIAAAVTTGLLLLLPARRERARASLRDRVAAARDRVSAALATGFDRELEAGRKRVREATEPYREFVRSEGERVRGLRTELQTHRQGLLALRARIESLR